MEKLKPKRINSVEDDDMFIFENFDLIVEISVKLLQSIFVNKSSEINEIDLFNQKAEYQEIAFEEAASMVRILNTERYALVDSIPVNIKENINRA